MINFSVFQLPLSEYLLKFLQVLRAKHEAGWWAAARLVNGALRKLVGETTRMAVGALRKLGRATTRMVTDARAPFESWTRPNTEIAQGRRRRTRQMPSTRLTSGLAHTSGVELLSRN